MPLKIKIVNKSKHPLPEYQTPQAAGVDLMANLDEEVILKTLERKLIGTGLYIELPEGYEAQIRPRSGLAAKYGITVINTPGTIDSDYRGEIKICLVNLSNEPYTVVNGERIAQMIIAKHEVVNFIMVENLSETKRGEGGHGHTGK
jgi:dUTP pyrophosphatase